MDKRTRQSKENAAKFKKKWLRKKEPKKSQEELNFKVGKIFPTLTPKEELQLNK